MEPNKGMLDEVKTFKKDGLHKTTTAEKNTLPSDQDLKQSREEECPKNPPPAKPAPK